MVGRLSQKCHGRFICHSPALTHNNFPWRLSVLTFPVQLGSTNSQDQITFITVCKWVPTLRFKTKHPLPFTSFAMATGCCEVHAWICLLNKTKEQVSWLFWQTRSLFNIYTVKPEISFWSLAWCEMFSSRWAVHPAHTTTCCWTKGPLSALCSGILYTERAQNENSD